MSSPSMTISPRLMPARYWMRRSFGTVASTSAMARWMRTALSTASTTLPNSTSSPSPVVLTMRPPCSRSTGSMCSRRCARCRAMVPASSASISRENPTMSIARMAASRRATRAAVPSSLVMQAEVTTRAGPESMYTKAA
jgi:hypothetical protein